MSDVTWILVVVCVCGYTTCGVSIGDVPEFQYPCYVDVCTFPRQFCNSDKHERRCSPCSRAICKSKRVPTACQYICIKYKEAENTTPRPSVTTSATHALHETALVPEDASATGCDKDLSSLYMLMGYSAIAVTILVVLGVAVASYVCNKRRNKQSLLQRKQTSFKSAIEMEDLGLEATKVRELNEVKQRLLQPREHCAMCGQGVQATNPPSYSTADLQCGATGPAPQTYPSETPSAATQTPPAATQTPPRQSIITNPTGDGGQGKHEKMMANGRLTCNSETNTDDPSHSVKRSLMKRNSGDSDQTSLKHQT